MLVHGYCNLPEIMTTKKAKGCATFRLSVDNRKIARLTHFELLQFVLQLLSGMEDSALNCPHG